MTSRSEPLLWIQLVSLGTYPLQVLLLLVLLAGSDSGPLPVLERMLCWSIGVLAPALLLWRRPADVWSLLLVRTPSRGRRDLQARLSALQDALPLRWGMASGAALALPMIWWLDRNAAIATGFSPLAHSPRLVGLLLASALLAVMLWQWQQLLQALWLLGRRPEQIAAASPLSQIELEEQRLCLGLPLLLPEALNIDAPVAAEPTAKASRPSVTAKVSGPAVTGLVDIPVAVEPEQTSEEGESPDLDQQVD